MAKAKPLQNSSVPVTVEDKLVCPKRDLVVGLPGRSRAAYVRVEDGALGLTVRKGSRVTLKANRRRLFRGEFVNKPESRERTVLSVDEYRFVDQFDDSAFAIPPSKRAPCTPFPAQRTTRRLSIPQGKFSTDEITLKKL